jgi:site-specific recombinase XerD
VANAGHDTRALQAWLGHKNIQHTVRYTALIDLAALATRCTRQETRKTALFSTPLL